MSAKKISNKTTPTVISFKTADEPKQTTLTQIYSTEADEESSLEEVFSPASREKRRKTTGTQGRVPVRTSEKFDGPLFEIGDLVMTTAEDINHPAIEHKRIHPSYIFVGCVTGWRKRKWACGNSTDFNHVIVNWMNIEKGNHPSQTRAEQL